ncbi:endoribonuclease Dicer-like [Oppia nitens]|uniref:endoribonuclease Dicer-like n=1 Tax=Oppia nitens TaxID=1686743 RepID=UPI0023DBD0BF|nr:endoribonuclease Dicer-like [Oppia nitens]
MIGANQSQTTANTMPPMGHISRRHMRANEMIDTKDFMARPYQVELYEVCKTRNTIVCLNTGGGKTFIAVMLIRHMSWQCVSDGKRTFFLVPLIPLVSQQASVIKTHTDLRVGQYSGSAYDEWTKEEWVQELEKYDVFVMIGEIFRSILQKGFISLSKVNLLVIDEVHRSVGNSPYREIMRMFDTCPVDKQPRILGLSASLILSHASPDKIDKMITELEKTTRSTCETASDLRTINKYATKPFEEIIEYLPFNMNISKNIHILKLIADSCIAFLEDIDYEALALQKNVVSVKTLCKSIKDTLYVLTTMGVWCAQKVSQLYIRELCDTVEMCRSSKSHYTAFISAVLTALNVIEVQLSQLLSGLTPNEKLLQYTSPKLLKLSELLKSQSNIINNTHLCCIIFTERRSVARVLCLWLQELVKSESSEYSHLKVDYVLGHGNRVGIGGNALSLMTSKKQEETLKKFRLHESNVLVATSVLEEGLDIPRCNFVIRYDLPKTFTEYIQSKGRARAELAKYIIFVEKSNTYDKMIDRLNKYRETEDILNKCCHNRVTPSEAEVDESFDDQLLEPYMPNKVEGSARVTLNSAIANINRYCLKLPSDSFTKLTPQYRIEEQSSGQYVCRLRLPINSQIRNEIISVVMPNKRTAKKAVALKACEILHKMKELDDNFYPVGKEAIDFVKELGLEPPEVEGDKANKVKAPGTAKRRQYYTKLVANVLKNCQIESHVRCYLYEFAMKLTQPIPEEQNTRGRQITDPADTSRNFGILTTNKVPMICDFPVFTRSGEVTIKFVPIRDDIYLSTQQYEDLLIFHNFTFCDVLRLIKYPLYFDSEKANSNPIVVPINTISNSGHKDIDWEFVSSIKRYKDLPPDSQSIEKRMNFEFDGNKYKDAVVIPWYRKDKPQFFFYVAEICTNLNPKSPFPDDGYETFEKYYLGKYNIEILNNTQPLLDVDHTSARLNLLTPRYVNRRGVSLPSSTAKTKKEKRENLQQKQILIPELCDVHPFPASLWRKAVCLPCLLFRLNSFLVAEQLRTLIAKQTGVGIVEPTPDMSWPSLDFGWTMITNEQNCEINDIESKQLSQLQQLTEPIQEVWDFSTENLSVEDNSNTLLMNNEQNNEQDFLIDTFDPNSYIISDDFDDDIEDEFIDNNWMSDIPVNIIGGPNGLRSTAFTNNWQFDTTSSLQSGVQIRELTNIDDSSQQLLPVRVGSPSVINGLSQNNAISNREWVIDEPTTVFPIGGCDAPAVDIISSTHHLNIASLTKDLANFPVEDFDSCDGFSDLDDIYSDDDEEFDNKECVSNSNNKQIGFNCHNKNDKTKIADILRYELLTECDNNVMQHKDDNEKQFLKLYKNICNEEEKLTEIKEMTYNSNIKSDDLSQENESLSELAQLFNDYLMDERNDLFMDQDFDLSDEETGDECHKTFDNFNELNINNNDKLGGDKDVKTNIDSVSFGDLLPNRDLNEPPEKPFIENFDPLKSDTDKVGPSPSLILQALTMSNASDGINLERLETVGDSFLKYAVTAFLYCVCPGIHEGRLSYLRSRQISNLNLYRLGTKIGIGQFMMATKFEPNDNWCPPCYAIPEGLEKALIESNADNESAVYDIGKIKGLNNLNEQQIRDQLKLQSNKSQNITIPYNLLTQHSIPDKSIADCVEALIGAYLISSGPRGALLFMKWLDLKVMRNDEDDDIDLNDPIWHWLPTPKSPLLTPFDESLSEVDNLQTVRKQLNDLYLGQKLDKFERKLGYEFKDKAYLVQAFTHNSYYENQVTDCYQRLEFLGDAVLDYLITRYLYEDPAGHSPGTLTDLRSALVNNTFFASLSVKYKFYKHLKMLSFDLFRVVMAFVDKFKNNDERNNDFNLFIAEGESENAEDIEVPKALGDIFESVAGAIYLDSGMSLDAVWKVYYKMMKPEIVYFSSHVPKSPIRELLEMEPQNAKFGKPELISGRKIRVCVEVFDFGKFYGIGRNKRIAKCTAAKRALRALKNRRFN